MTERIKKIILPTVLILISIGLGLGAFWYFPHQEAVKECKIECRYDEHNKVWKYGFDGGGGGFTSLAKARRFPAQEQCIDYCLTVK